MKQLIALLILSGGLLINPVSAQKSNKFGHVNSAELLGLMPERKAAAAKMDSITKEVQKQMQDMMTEYRSKQEKLSTDGPKLSDLVKKDKEEELTGLATRIQNFQESAQQTLQDEESKLIEPIVSKAKKAIEQVAKENGYTYVFDTSGGALLFWEESDNVIALVKKKLNLP
jgi:outer membrane protein